MDSFYILCQSIQIALLIGGATLAVGYIIGQFFIFLSYGNKKKAQKRTTSKKAHA